MSCSADMAYRYVTWSMNNMHGELSRAFANMLATFFSDSPTIFDLTCEPYEHGISTNEPINLYADHRALVLTSTSIKLIPSSAPSAQHSAVLPTPGGPCISTPLGGFIPSLMYSDRSRKGLITDTLRAGH